ncbi:MAG TPA: hypothetical protein VFB19_07660 [Mycobacterium sp.]|nr:hypothetical protein [Mycobacterium sp.]
MAVRLSSRRLVIAGGFVLLVVAPPGVAHLGATAAGDPHNLATPSSTCTVTATKGSASLVCPPGAVSNGTTVGAPSEQDLTATNSVRHIGGGGLL